MTLAAGPQIKTKPGIAVYGGDVPTLLYSDPALGGDGRTRLNPRKGTSRWLWLAADYQGATPMTLASGDTRKMIAAVKTTGGNEDGDFEMSTILARSAATAGGALARVAIQPYVKSKIVNRFLTNQNVCHTLLTGVSQFPGSLIAAPYLLPKTSIEFTVQNLSGVETGVSIAGWGRQWTDCDPCDREERRKHAEHLRWFHPYWIGPQDPSQPAYTGPEVTLGPGRQATLTFPMPSDADFLMYSMLDDSTSSGGGEPALYAQVSHNDSQRGLVDLPSTTYNPAVSSALGISWRDFLAIPTATGVTGFQQSKINAYGLAPQNGGWTHVVPRNTQIIIKFVSMETVNTITLRVALYGLLVYGLQPADRLTSIDGLANRERIEQAREFLRRMAVPIEHLDAFASGKDVGGKAWQ